MLWRWPAGESKVNRVGWLEWDGAEDLRSRSKWWLALLSSAGEDRGAWFMEAMLLRVSVKGKKRTRCSDPTACVARIFLSYMLRHLWRSGGFAYGSE